MSDKEPSNMSDKEQPAKKQKVKQQSDMGDFLDPSKCFRKNKRKPNDS
jgi:hypothetical protein